MSSSSQTYYSEKQGSTETSTVIPGETTAGPAHEVWFTVACPTAGIISNVTYAALLQATKTSPSDSLQMANCVTHKNRKDAENTLLAKGF